MKYEKYYSEKFLVMPHSFLSNSFAYQSPDMSVCTLELPKYDNPSVNKCGLMGLEKKNSEADAFVYCNFNKHLKLLVYVTTYCRQWKNSSHY